MAICLGVILEHNYQKKDRWEVDKVWMSWECLFNNLIKSPAFQGASERVQQEFMSNMIAKLLMGETLTGADVLLSNKSAIVYKKELEAVEGSQWVLLCGDGKSLIGEVE